MSDDPNRYDWIVEWLTEQGYTQEERDQVLEHVRQYDRNVQHDSVMDSIADGSLDLRKMVDEVLGK